MEFIRKIIDDNIPIWDQCMDTPFVQDMKSGRLSLENFKEYMIQDSIYLKHYARIYGKAIYHAVTLREIRIYHSMMDFVTEQESTVRLHYLEQFGITDDEIELITPLPENRNYLDFMYTVAERGDGCEILMAVLPCMLSYSYLFRRLLAKPESWKSKYRDFIDDYADDRYAENCRQWCIFAQQKCGALSGTEQEKLGHIFKRASLLELDFWNMVYRKHTGKRKEKTES